MPKQMFINVVNEEESRIAKVSNGLLDELSIETSLDEFIEGNIYKARVDRILASLDAVFVDYGRDRNGFLAISEIRPEYFTGGERKADNLKRNIEILVQVKKGEIGEKGAALTTYISIPGRYMVLMPFVDKRGVSRQIEDEKERRTLKKLVDDTVLPDGVGYIVRTAAMDRTKTEVQRDVTYLVRLWKRIQALEESNKAPSLLYRDSDIVIRTIRDYFTPDVTEVLVDDAKIYERVKGFFKAVMPHHAKKLKLYEGHAPLFSKHELEAQITAINQEKVKLPSGGSIVIQQTEALVSVDVNSGGGAKSKDIEETALTTNMEAATEVSRQLRLRDMGGLVVIDFIDMRSSSNRGKVKKELNKALKNDKARISVGSISKFGLMELSRQRLKGSAKSKLTISCPLCEGTGTIRSPEGFALSVLRLVHATLARNRAITRVHVSVSVSAANFLLNRKRQQLDNLQDRFKALVDVFVEPDFHPNVYHIEFSMPGKNRIETNLPADYSQSRLLNREALPYTDTQAQKDQLSYDALPDTIPEDTPEPRDSETSTSGESVSGGDNSAGGEATENAPKKKRRRRRRKKKPSNANREQTGGEESQGTSEVQAAGAQTTTPAAMTAPTDKTAEAKAESTGAVTQPEQTGTDGEEKPKSKSRRRRRRPRSRAKTPGTQTGSEEQKTTPAQQAPTPVQPTPAQKAPAIVQEAPAQQASAPAQAAAPTPPSSPATDAAPATTAAESEAPKPKPRRTRRPRKPKTVEAAATTPAPETNTSAPETTTPVGEVKTEPAPKKHRPTRRRRKPATQKSETKSETGPENNSGNNDPDKDKT